MMIGEPVGEDWREMKSRLAFSLASEKIGKALGPHGSQIISRSSILLHKALFQKLFLWSNDS